MNKTLTLAKPFRAKKAQSGMAMIEVLITILVSTIGLLGIASLQSVALKGSLDSSQRTAATSIVGDLVERIRANPVGRRADNYAEYFVQYASCAKNTPPPVNICSDYYDQANAKAIEAVSCTGEQLAEFDAWELSCGYLNKDKHTSSPVNFLVAPTITVMCTDAEPADAFDCSDNSDHEIELTWTASSKAANRNDGNETRTVAITTGI